MGYIGQYATSASSLPVGSSTRNVNAAHLDVTIRLSHSSAMLGGTRLHQDDYPNIGPYAFTAWY